MNNSGYRLDDLAWLNLNTGKTGNGALAPELYQKGQWGKLIDYCLQDVNLTRMLFNKIHVGNAKTPKGGVRAFRVLNAVDEGVN